jgi:nanoRNase/pAp phosphatase (c-di-AMP/oligoRNAs hydrolase)
VWSTVRFRHRPGLTRLTKVAVQDFDSYFSGIRGAAHAAKGGHAGMAACTAAASVLESQNVHCCLFMQDQSFLERL